MEVAMLASQNSSRQCAHAIFEREVTHRTANLLQHAFAAVNMSRRGDKSYVDEALRRLAGASELHRLLGPSRPILIDLAETIECTCEATLRATGASEWVLPHYDLDSTLVDSAASRPLLMAVAELFGNSIRHAFPERQGSVLVALRDRGDSMVLAIEDDGVCAGWWRPEGQGHEIVDDLAAMIGGRIDRSITAGGSSRIKITFPTLSAAAACPAGAA
jgi:two-component sensor histidine kinase